MDFSALDKLITGLFSLTVGALIGSELRRYFYKPNVVVKYKDIEPLHDKSGVYWSLQMENYGRTVAKDCVAALTITNINKNHILMPGEVDTYENLPEYKNEARDLETPRKQIVKREHFRLLNRVLLCWSKLGNPDTLSINPGISHSIDLCKFHLCESGNYFIFPSEEGWRRVRVRVKPQIYKGHILICPSNEFPTRVDFEIGVTKKNKSYFKLIKPSIFKNIFKRKFD